MTTRRIQLPTPDKTVQRTGEGTDILNESGLVIERRIDSGIGESIYTTVEGSTDYGFVDFTPPFDQTYSAGEGRLLVNIKYRTMLEVTLAQIALKGDADTAGASVMPRANGVDLCTAPIVLLDGSFAVGSLIDSLVVIPENSELRFHSDDSVIGTVVLRLR